MQLFYELIQVAVGSREALSHIPTSGEWSDLFAASQKQSLVGIAFQGLTKLYSSNPELVVNLPVELKMNWMAMTLDIQRGNSLKGKWLVQLRHWVQIMCLILPAELI